jgi:hypothetical protein
MRCLTEMVGGQAFSIGDLWNCERSDGSSPATSKASNRICAKVAQSADRIRMVFETVSLDRNRLGFWRRRRLDLLGKVQTSVAD